MKKAGESLYIETEHSGPPFIIQTDRPKVWQGFIEASNVNPVTEMVRLIEVHRTYEANQKTIQTEDSMLGRVINEVGKA